MKKRPELRLVVSSATLDAEEFMKYCKCCYVMSCNGVKMKPSNANFEKRLKVGRCRLCTGAISNSSHQYCLKCYSAKQRDDAKRIQKDLYQKQFKKLHLRQPVQTVPYVCMDCGSTIHDCSWKTKCPPCFAISRTSTQRKPKLIKPPVKRQFQGKPKYRS